MGLFDRFKSKKKDASGDLGNLFTQMRLMAFPGGDAQIEREADEIYNLLAGKVSRDQAKNILTRSKSLLVIAQDKSEQRIADSIYQSSSGSLTMEDARAIYRHLAGDTEVQVPSGDGSSMESAVIINAKSAIVAVPVQYQWMNSRFGSEGEDYSLGTRMHLQGANGRRYTMHEIVLSNGESRQVFFDITASSGNF